ncbi:hypothetical protein BSY19_5421 (plasmid) [Bosea sp. RAC05]|nr:hypothetical protein BSY19_5421 [Bosea sp. RAC05]
MHREEITVTPSTAIEALVAQANAEEGSPGFHVTARFQDGSVIDAPILDHGPNWMRVAEIVEDGFSST